MSGHPSTTLGNTMRSLTYAFYYLEQAGIYSPWQYLLCFVCAAGDDTVFWVVRRLVQVVLSTLLSLTVRTKDQRNVGLGQCVKEAHVGEFWEIDFCSKWSFYDGSEWMLTRDV